MPTKAVAKKQGLSVRTFKGLDKKRMAKSSGGANAGLRISIKQGETVPVQFLTKPEEFTEFEQHSWQDAGRWNYVPCMGETCPLCMDENRLISKKGYRFAVAVYNLKERKVQILEGPKDLAGRIFYRYERAPSKFLKRTYDVTKFPTQPVTYDFAIGEDDLIQTTGLKGIPDIEVYLENELKRYFGDDLPDVEAVTSKDDEDDDEDDEEDEYQEYTMSDLKKMKLAKLREIAETLDIETEDMDKSDLIDAIVEAQDEDEDDEDDEDEDEEDEDEDGEEEDEDEEDEDEDEDEEDDEDEDEEDDEDEEEAPAPRKRAVAKKAAAKKAPAKKAPAKKAAARKAPSRR